MNLLVRLYPSAWRERYGVELEAVLEDRPPGPFDVARRLGRCGRRWLVDPVLCDRRQVEARADSFLRR